MCPTEAHTWKARVCGVQSVHGPRAGADGSTDGGEGVGESVVARAPPVWPAVWDPAPWGRPGLSSRAVTLWGLRLWVGPEPLVCGWGDGLPGENLPSDFNERPALRDWEAAVLSFQSVPAPTLPSPQLNKAPLPSSSIHHAL